MRIFILSMVLFLASCSNLSVQDEAIVVTTIKGEESMNDKVYSSQPDMNIDLSKSYTASIFSETCVKPKVVIKTIVSNPIKEILLPCINISPYLICIFLFYLLHCRACCANLC